MDYTDQYLKRAEAWQVSMGRLVFPERYYNPLTAVEVVRYGTILRGLLLSLDRQIVGAAFIGEGERDLLGTVGEEVHGIREFLDRWIGAAPEPADLGGRGLAVLDAFEDEGLAAAEHSGLPGGGRSLTVPEVRG